MQCLLIRLPTAKHMQPSGLSLPAIEKQKSGKNSPICGRATIRREIRNGGGRGVGRRRRAGWRGWGRGGRRGEREGGRWEGGRGGGGEGRGGTVGGGNWEGGRGGDRGGGRGGMDSKWGNEEEERMENEEKRMWNGWNTGKMKRSVGLKDEKWRRKERLEKELEKVVQTIENMGKK